MEGMSDYRRWMITIAVMLVTVLEVLDLTIVNVALPYMKGTLNATTDEISWVITSYVVSSAIMMPLTGYLIDRIGLKKLLLTNVVGFLLSSMLCGMSNSLQMMVFCRIAQGVFGASLVPLSQFILRSIFPPEELTKAMAIWGMGIMAGPVLGPSLGGYITDALNWRWIFFVNIPVCILAFFLSLRFLQDTATKVIKTDWMGMFLLATCVGSFQIFLDRGNNVDWFASQSIRWLCLTAIASFVIFIVRGLSIENNIINLKLFLNRNFTLGCLMLVLFSSSLFSILTLQPILMESFMNYDANYAGWMMAPRGIASAFAMGFTPLLARYVELRKIIAIGLILCTLGTYMMTKINLQIAPITFIEIGLIQGVGMGFFFVPLSNLTMATIPREAYGEASGLFSFWRSLGISIGVSVMMTLLTNNSQINWNRLGGHIQPFSPGLQLWLARHHLHLYDKLAIFQLSQQLATQSYMISFLNDFLAATYSFLIIIPLAFLLEKPKHAGISLGH